MAYSKNNDNCSSSFNIKKIGVCDVSKLNIDGSKKSDLSWTEVSIPELLTIPTQKPDIENINRAYVKVILNNINLIETSFASKIHDLPPTTTVLTDIENTVTPVIANLNTVITALRGTVTPFAGYLGVLRIFEIVFSNPTMNPGGLVERETSVYNNAITELSISIPNTTTNLENALNRLLAETKVPNTNLATLKDYIDLVLNLNNELINSVNSVLSNSKDALALWRNLSVQIPDLNQPIATLEGVINPMDATLVPNVLNLLNPLNTGLNIKDVSLTKALEIIPNAEGTCLSGRKLIIEGTLSQKIVYTANVDSQSVHSAIFEFPFTTFIIPYPSFEGLSYEEGIVISAAGVVPEVKINGFRYNPSTTINVDLCEEFSVDICIEDIFVNALNLRQIFKSVTLFLHAKPVDNS